MILDESNNNGHFEIRKKVITYNHVLLHMVVGHIIGICCLLGVFLKQWATLIIIPTVLKVKAEKTSGFPSLTFPEFYEIFL